METLSVSLCPFLNRFFLSQNWKRNLVSLGEASSRFRVAEKKRVMKYRVGYVRIPGSIFSPIARFLTYELTFTSDN